MKFEHTEVTGFEAALRGMRNPKDSWHLGDSVYMPQGDNSLFVGIGPNDMKLAQSLIHAGSEHRKFLRFIEVSVDITAPLYFWSEYDTYKVGTVANSCSTMHKLHAYQFTADMFGADESEWDIDDLSFWTHALHYLEVKRNKYLIYTKHNSQADAMNHFRKLKQALPASFEQRRTVKLNYETLFAMCSKGQRRYHRLTEWSSDFMDWARSLPYAQELIFIDELEDRDNAWVNEMFVRQGSQTQSYCSSENPALEKQQ